MSKSLHRAALALPLLVLLASLSEAAPPDAKGIEYFETKVRPLFVKHCLECHSTTSPKLGGGLLLDSKDGILRGGDSGPALVPGQPDQSLIIKAVRHIGLKMPKKDKLPDAAIADLVQWVALGAPDPREKAAVGYKRMTLAEATTFWSLVPVQKATPPTVKNAWARTDIDRFVLAKLEAKGLKPAVDAERRVLIRRLYYDLIGLPPTPEEVDAFEKTAAAKPQAAIEAVVDHLLASPHFGERWGRHWLDMARYAESNGNADNTPFPHAFRYRDYVIAALNKDKPYDQFIREQVAGDLLAAHDAAEKDEHLVATGFLALTSKPRAQNNPDYRMDLIADQIDVTTRAVLGLSVLCARCHDHKFDPIAQKEYYALAGIFESTSMLFGSGGKGGGKKQAGPGGFYTLSDKSEAMGVEDGKATDSALCIRGDSHKRGETVPRGFVAIATPGKAPTISRASSGRAELARWLTNAENPLTARVAANRVWLHLFGQGLVRTPDNFGSLGEKPSHPELLDYLAGWFVENGWSTKKLIRTIVLSRAYQMGSAPDAAGLKIDPDNVWLWRMSPRRLEAEAIRDAMLAVGGKLERKPPQGSMAEVKKGGKKPSYETKDANVRSVYLGVLRGAPLPELLTMFDVANPNLAVAQREVTTVPAQSLFLLNSPWVVTQSKAFAQRVLADKKLDDAGRVDLAYRLALARSPNDAEKAKALAYVKGAGVAGADRAWSGFCQALFASAEFRYVE